MAMHRLYAAVIIITQPRKSHYISSGRVNLMICLQTQVFLVGFLYSTKRMRYSYKFWSFLPILLRIFRLLCRKGRACQKQNSCVEQKTGKRKINGPFLREDYTFCTACITSAKKFPLSLTFSTSKRGEDSGWGYLISLQITQMSL